MNVREIEIYPGPMSKRQVLCFWEGKTKTRESCKGMTKPRERQSEQHFDTAYMHKWRLRRGKDGTCVKINRHADWCEGARKRESLIGTCRCLYAPNIHTSADAHRGQFKGMTTRVRDMMIEDTQRITTTIRVLWVQQLDAMIRMKHNQYIKVEVEQKNTKGANLGFFQQLVRIHICILRLLAQFDSISKQLSHVIWINDRFILCQCRLGYGWFG